MKNRPLTKHTFAANLNMLMRETGMSARELSRQCGGKDPSDRYVGMLLNAESDLTADMADKIGKVFGLTGWQMLIPGLRSDIAKSGKLEELIQHYAESTEEGRKHIERTAENEPKVKVSINAGQVIKQPKNLVISPKKVKITGGKPKRK